MENKISIIECPRDAMQGLSSFIKTEDKIVYLNALMKVGFDVLDFGSFVSPKAVPQMQDTAEVLSQLDMSDSKTKLLAIVVNERGAIAASEYEQIIYLGYPYSISETFLHNNMRSNGKKAFDQMKLIKELCHSKNKELVVYISMAFGNPYGDIWGILKLEQEIKRIEDLGITTIALSDTTGSGTPEIYKEVFEHIMPLFPNLEIGLHLHAPFGAYKEKLEVAYAAGCRRFDTVINDKGGCPMSGQEMSANLNTYQLLSFLDKKNAYYDLDMNALDQAAKIAKEIFPEG